MNQVLKREKLEFLIKPEEIYVVSSKKEVKEEEVEVQKAHKKLKFFSKHKKTIGIEKVKRDMNANIYRNRFAMY